MSPATAPKETPATASDILLVSKALSQLLSEETALMNTMQIAKVGELQERKLKLTTLLERYMRYIHKHPDVMQRMSAEEKADLRAMDASFRSVMKKNYDTLLVARAVNGTVVKCVRQAATRKDSNPTYTAKGSIVAPPQLALSITLNQTI